MRLRELFRGGSALTLSALLHASLLAALLHPLVAAKKDPPKAHLPVELELRETPKPQPERHVGAAVGSRSSRAEDGLTGVVRPAKQVVERQTPSKRAPSAATKPWPVVRKPAAARTEPRTASAAPAPGPRKDPEPVVERATVPVRRTQQPSREEAGSRASSPAVAAAETATQPPRQEGSKREATDAREEVQRREPVAEKPGTSDADRPEQRESKAQAAARAESTAAEQRRGDPSRAEAPKPPTAAPEADREAKRAAHANAATSTLRAAEDRPESTERAEAAGSNGRFRAASGSVALMAAGPVADGDRESSTSVRAARGEIDVPREHAPQEPNAPATDALQRRTDPTNLGDASAHAVPRPAPGEAEAREKREEKQAQQQTTLKREAVAMVVPVEPSKQVPPTAPAPAAEPAPEAAARAEKLRAMQEELRRVQELLERLANDTGPSAPAQIAEALVTLTVVEHKLQDLQQEQRQEAPIQVVVAPEGAGAGEVAGDASLEGDADLRMLVQVRVNEVVRMVGPLAVRRAGRSGAALVRVRFDPRGYVEEVEFLQSTGSKVLDDEVDVVLHLGEPYVGVQGWVRIAVNFAVPES